MNALASFFLVLYRVGLSPILHQGVLFSGGCRFSPSCSAYGLEAIRQYGLLNGSMLLVRRLALCRPGGGAGFDPVPERHDTGGKAGAVPSIQKPRLLGMLLRLLRI